MNDGIAQGVSRERTGLRRGHGANGAHLFGIVSGNLLPQPEKALQFDPPFRRGRSFGGPLAKQPICLCF